MKVIYKEKGVASVIGTLFALLLGVTLLSLFMTQYVPTYMHTSEAQRDMTLLSQYSQIKTDVDVLISTSQLNYTIYSSLTLGANGIPIFGVSTPSSLRIEPVRSPNSPMLYVNFTTGNVSFQSGGMIDSYMYNAYYVQEKIAFVDGFVIRENVDQNNSTVYVGTGFTIANVSGKYYNIFLTIYNIIGSNYYYVGTDSKNVGVSLLAIVKNTYVTNTLYLNATGDFSNVILNWFYNQGHSFFNDPYINITQNGNSLMFQHVGQINLNVAYVYVQVPT